MKSFFLVIVSAFIFLPMTSQSQWKVDLSRRMNDLRKQDQRLPANTKSPLGMFDVPLTAPLKMSEIVVLNTERGFIPSTIRVRENSHYKIHIVNVNEKSKNISFVLDSFSEHHATYYGEIKTFHIHPKKEGVYSFQSPETSAQGKLVVYPESGSAPSSSRVRTPASR